MRQLVSYYGGTQRLASEVLDWCPRHTVWVEPYCGGAALTFARARPIPSNTHHYREVLNDHDARIMTIYRVAQDPRTRQALQERLTYTPYSREAHREALAIIRTGWAEADPVTRAWAMVVSLQQSFANNLNAGWSTSVFGRNHAATWANWRDALPACFDRLRDVYLECDDAVAVIKRWDSPQTLFVCDPPYPGANQGHYAGFTVADLQALVVTLDTCQGSFVLLGYQSLVTIPDAWEHRTLEAYCSASSQGRVGADRTRAATPDALGQRQRTVHLWRVDRSAAMRHELQALFTPQVAQEALNFDP